MSIVSNIFYFFTFSDFIDAVVIDVVSHILFFFFPRTSNHKDQKIRKALDLLNQWNGKRNLIS